MERSRVCKGAKSSSPYCISLILYTKTHIHKHTIHPYLPDQLCLTLRLEWWVLKWIPPVLVFLYDRPCECDCEHIPPVFHSLIVVRDAKDVLTYFYPICKVCIECIMCCLIDKRNLKFIALMESRAWCWMRTLPIDLSTWFSCRGSIDEGNMTFVLVCKPFKSLLSVRFFNVF